MRRRIALACLAVLVTLSAYARDQAPEPSATVRDRGAREILIADSGWNLLGEGYHLTGDSTVDAAGTVYFSDARRNRILTIDPDGRIGTWREDTSGAHGVALGPDGRVYAGQHEQKRIVAFSRAGAESVITEGVQSHHLTVTSRRHIYFTVPPTRQVWLVETPGQRRVVHEGFKWPRGVRTSPDESALVVSDPPANQIWSFRIQSDGSLSDGRPLYRLETSREKPESDAGGMAFDSEGFLYVATTLGVQVCDRQGRVTAIIGAPGESVSAVLFGGRDLQWLYVTDGSKVWRRAVRRHGAAPWGGSVQQR